ncbi:alpha/beta fold hydrolase [Salinispira pacifica]
MQDLRQKGTSAVLPDGRRLGYAEFGDPAGRPFFFLHGWPGTRIEASLLRATAAERGIRLVAIDRPGVGLSDLRPGLTILNFSEDVASLADVLGLGRFVLLGASAGAPFAAACAFSLRDRLAACGLVSSLAPPGTDITGMKPSNRVVQFISRRTPWLLPFLVWLSLGRNAGNAERTREGMRRGRSQLSVPDQQLLAREEIEELFVQDTMEAFRSGSRGVVQEGRLLGRPWGFRLEEIAGPAVFVWHGGQDSNSPPSHGRAIADAIAGSRFELLPDDGHLSTLFNHGAEILDRLMEAGRF